MISEIFLSAAIMLQVGAAISAFRLVRITGHAVAWVLISFGLLLMAVRRVLPLYYIIAGTSSGTDPVNEFIGMVLSGFMLAGVMMIRPIFEKIFESERVLMESEKRFRSYFELPLVGIALVSADLRWMTVNERLCQILGIPMEKLIGKSLFESMEDSQTVEAEIGKIKEIVKGEADGYILDKVFMNESNAEPVWVSQAARCVRNQDGSVKYYVLILQDISERKAYETMLCGAVKEKETLLRELYHRTKNNMQVICSFLNLQCYNCEDPKMAEEFLDIANRIKSMSLVHDQLYCTRDLSHIDFADYVQELAGILFKSHDRRIEEKIRTKLSVEHIIVSVDIAIPCGLIMNELISNCLKHAFPDERKGNIAIEASCTGNEVNLVVQDDGIGAEINDDQIKKRRLGLQVAYTLTDQIEGTLTFSSNGHGLTASLTFPNNPYPDRLSPKVVA